jgi:hypothetical protein
MARLTLHPFDLTDKTAPAATRAAALLEPDHQLAAELLRPLCREN